ncbi:hypothetical protein B296_00020632 [Ensete ventricosum]|uniref:Uncharacterized protein n=1 Tax=Ensete ventricosum TaxID=4639 RepID=A0A426XU67_ENSVE|nr:hypothetical protein B296_00020632 [Ensete ventricosum]
MGRRRDFKFFGKRGCRQITLSGFSGVTSDFSYPCPSRELHDSVVRRDHCPKFVELGPANDGVVNIVPFSKGDPRVLAPQPLFDCGPDRAICALNAATCSVGLVLPSYGSRAGSRKLEGIGLSRILGANGDLPLMISPTSTLDLVDPLVDLAKLFHHRVGRVRGNNIRLWQEAHNISGTVQWLTTETFGFSITASAGGRGAPPGCSPWDGLDWGASSRTACRGTCGCWWVGAWAS